MVVVKNVHIPLVKRLHEVAHCFVLDTVVVYDVSWKAAIVLPLGNFNFVARTVVDHDPRKRRLAMVATHNVP